MKGKTKSAGKSKNIEADPEKNDIPDNLVSEKGSIRKLKKNCDDVSHGSQKGQKKLTSYFGMSGLNFEETAT